MNAKISDVMTPQVMTASPHQRVGHIGKVMQKNGVNCMPVVDSEGVAVGIISTTDVLRSEKEGTPISKLMTEKVYTVPKYADVSLAARIMRNHRIHHVVVTHEGRCAGIVSAFDLLQLVENHRFLMKNAPAVSERRGGKRKKKEQG